MLSHDSALQITSGLSEGEQLHIEAEWGRREAELDEALREPLPGEYSHTCLVGIANQLLASPVNGGFGCTVYSRERRTWTDDPYRELGIKFMPTEPEAPAQYASFCALHESDVEINTDTIPLRPMEGILFTHAVTVAVLGIRKAKWATLRGLWLNEDCTALVLPPLSLSPAPIEQPE